MAQFAIDDTFWLNLVASATAGVLVWLANTDGQQMQGDQQKLEGTAPATHGGH